MTESTVMDMQALIRRLTTAVATATLYDLQHRQVSFLCQQALEHVQRLLAEEEDISLLLVEDQLIFANAPLEPNLATSKLIRYLRQRGIGHVKFRAGITASELLEMVAVLGRQGAAATEIASSEHIRYGRVEVHTDQADRDSNTTETLQNFPELAEIAQAELDKFMDIYQQVHSGRQLNVRGLAEIVGSFVQAFSEQGNPLLALAPLRNMDAYTYTHSTNVCILNIAQARMLGMEGQVLHDIGIAAMLHDIGKLFVPLEVLQKPGQLTDQEWALMQSHPVRGAEYLVNTPGIPRLAVLTAYEHHIRYDKTGYPKVGKNWQQHLCSYMTTISDFFDALRTHRSYRAGMDLQKISAIMLEEAGRALHPQLTRNLLKAISQLDPQAQAESAAS